MDADATIGETVDEDINYPAWHFHWVVENKLAAMARPQNVQNLLYLCDEGISHLITLSPEKKPPIDQLPAGSPLKWCEIPIEEFEAPTLDDIKRFIEICTKADRNNEKVAIHCRMGKGRTGVLGACYLVHFQKQTPADAIETIRKLRPGAIETPEQEQSIFAYFDHIQGK